MPKDKLLYSDERENIKQIAIYLRELFIEEPSNEIFETLYDLWETKVSGRLWDYGLYNDYLEFGKIVLECAKEIPDQQIKLKLLGEVGYVCMERGMYDLAESYFSESLEYYISTQDSEGQCRSLRYLATLSLRQNKLDFAREYINQGLNIIIQNEHIRNYTWKFNQSEFYSLRGEIELNDRKPVSAKTYFSKAFRVSRTLPKKSEYYQLGHLRSLGRCLYFLGNYKKAVFMYKFCLKKSKEVNRLDLIVSASIDLAETLLMVGENELARKYLNEAIDLSEDNYPLLVEKAINLLNSFSKHVAA